MEGGGLVKVLGVLTLGVGRPNDSGVAETYDLCVLPPRPQEREKGAA